MNPHRGLLKTLELIPSGVAYSILIRHAERYRIEGGAFGEEVTLTPAGIDEARRLGAQLPRPVSAYHSPLYRCLQTTEQLLLGSGVSFTPEPLDALFLAFFDDLAAAERVLTTRQVRPVVRSLCRGEAVEGMRDLASGSGELLGQLFEPSTPGLHLFCSHDHILCLLNHFLRGLDDFDERYWPEYLEGMAFWREGEQRKAAFRGEVLEL